MSPPPPLPPSLPPGRADEVDLGLSVAAAAAVVVGWLVVVGAGRSPVGHTQQPTAPLQLQVGVGEATVGPVVETEAHTRPTRAVYIE